MSDTTSTQKIIIDTTQAGETITDITQKMIDMAKYAAEAKEGVTHIAGEYQFANKNLQAWYDKLKEMGLAHNKMTLDIINDMQNAARAVETSTKATGEHAKALHEVNKGILSSEENKKRLFEDVGRLLAGEKIGLRQMASNFGLLGPEVVIVSAAIGFLSEKLIEYYEDTNDAARATKELGEIAKEAAKGMAEPIIQVEKMNQTFKDADEGRLDRKKALEDYNKEFGKSMGYAKSLNEAESIFASKSGAYVTSMQLRAEADAAANLQKKALEIATEKQVTGEVSTWDRIKAGAISMIKLRTSDTEEIKKLNKEEIDDANKKADDYGAIYKKLTAAARKNDQDNGISTETDDTKAGKQKKEHDNSIEEEKRYEAESAKISETAREKEITGEEIKYKKIYDDLVKHHHSTEALTVQHNANIAAINKKFDDAEDAKIKKEKEKEAAELRKALETLEKEEDAFDKKADQSEKNKFDRELDNVKAQYKKLLDQEMLYGRDITKIQLAYGQQVKAIEDARSAQRYKDEQKQIADSIKANKTADQQIINSETLTNNQKLALLKKSLDGWRDMYEKKGQLTLEDQQKQQDDLAAFTKIQNEKLKVQKEIVGGISTVLNAASEVLGKNTQAGKDVAIASATISAIQGAVSAFTSMAAIPIVGPALGVVAAAAALAAGYANIKKITEVKVPGQSGGSAPNLSPGGGLPGAPSIPTKSNTTNLSRASLGQIRHNTKPQTLVAHVIEADVTGSQRRIASYQNGSSLH